MVGAGCPPGALLTGALLAVVVVAGALAQGPYTPTQEHKIDGEV